LDLKYGQPIKREFFKVVDFSHFGCQTAFFGVLNICSTLEASSIRVSLFPNSPNRYRRPNKTDNHQDS